MEGTKLMQGDVFAFKEKATAIFKVRDVGGLDWNSDGKDGEQ